jgi:hypothetical protein
VKKKAMRGGVVAPNVSGSRFGASQNRAAVATVRASALIRRGPIVIGYLLRPECPLAYSTETEQSRASARPSTTAGSGSWLVKQKHHQPNSATRVTYIGLQVFVTASHCSVGLQF